MTPGGAAAPPGDYHGRPHGAAAGTVPAAPRSAPADGNRPRCYEGYLAKEEAQIRKARQMEQALLPEDIPYQEITGLRLEARQKLAAQRPALPGRRQPHSRRFPRGCGRAHGLPGQAPPHPRTGLIPRKQKTAAPSRRFRRWERGRALFCIGGTFTPRRCACRARGPAPDR